jgi:hypothetical protein
MQDRQDTRTKTSDPRAEWLVHVRVVAARIKVFQLTAVRTLSWFLHVMSNNILSSIHDSEDCHVLDRAVYA